MAEIEFIECKPPKENRIEQGDIIFCEGSNGALDFWAIYDKLNGTVTSLDGAGSRYFGGKELYLYGVYNYWTITKRIPREKVKITIEEIE